MQLWDSCLREIRTAEWDQATRSTQGSVLSLMLCSSYQRGTEHTDMDVAGGSGNSLAVSK